MIERVRRLHPNARVLLALAAAALVAGGIWFAWWTVSPLFRTVVVQEELSAPDVAEDAFAVLLQGAFEGADAFHQVSGAARVIDRGADRIVRFENDFRTVNGPDLFVWLANGENYDEGVLDLGVLKGNVGSQNYVVPEGTDLSRYDRVIIWCRAFRVLFGTALLES